ncbi:PREDICTED: uncharacterized protein LOC109479392 [Branchiostoma belcheri]|uniref:Uncharacterized protein LOC109479392 n=1 Tax=Branchiostoma belcheri TaxID=7741 RepID=A0A6P5A552_BRABE|nr:PREDICTED: uncharacterized protein LOC109479392 [Branchiostoma belcheri]
MSNTPVLKIIVGNKSDLEHRTSEQAAAELAAAFGCELVLQVSARTGEGMKEALQVIAGKLLARSRERKRSHLTSPASDDVSPLTLGRRDTTETRQTSRCCWRQRNDRETTERRQRDDRRHGTRDIDGTRQRDGIRHDAADDRDTTETRQRHDRETTE